MKNDSFSFGTGTAVQKMSAATSKITSKLRTEKNAEGSGHDQF